MSKFDRITHEKGLFTELAELTERGLMSQATANHLSEVVIPRMPLHQERAIRALALTRALPSDDCQLKFNRVDQKAGPKGASGEYQKTRGYGWGPPSAPQGSSAVDAGAGRGLAFERERPGGGRPLPLITRCVCYMLLGLFARGKPRPEPSRAAEINRTWGRY